MKRTAYGTPLLIDQTNRVTPVAKVRDFDERTIQQLIFDHPGYLTLTVKIKV